VPPSGCPTQYLSGDVTCVAGASNYERRQIESVLPQPNWAIDPGSALVLLPRERGFHDLYTAGIAPALMENRLNRADVHRVFNDESPLADVMMALSTAQLIVADVSRLNGAVLYVLGIAHAIGRSPILLTRDPGELPFDLHRLRRVEYAPTPAGLQLLRQNLARAVRVLLSAMEAG